MIEKNILRALVLEILSQMPKTQINHVIGAVERLVAERGLFPSSDDCQRLGVDYQSYQQKQLNPIDNLTISEVIWDLILEHVVTPGENMPDKGFPFFRLTEFGKDYISQSAPHYYDPQGYMKFLRNIVQNLDPVIEQYIFESLNCYRRQLFFASAVMIGAAAEKAILLLLQAITNSMSNPSSKRKAAQLIDKPNLPEIFDTIRKTVEPLIKAKTIPYSVHKGCTEHLMSLFEMIRVQRNDAIHPVCGQVDRTKVFLSLQTIPAALETINKLVEWLGSNSIP
ncbi:MAG TPA: hypothetical protein VMV84_02340 [Dehalococcoidales bacterium]|nr:hypothetical protein [Dehalococcoidales bacterium]